MSDVGSARKRKKARKGVESERRGREERREYFRLGGQGSLIRLFLFN